jgi:hypothetical protein
MLATFGGHNFVFCRQRWIVLRKPLAILVVLKFFTFGKEALALVGMSRR